MAQKPPAYQHYVKEWLVGTMHLTLEQQGAYQRLLDHQWDGDGLPTKPDVLARLIGATPAEWQRVWPPLRKKFPIAADGLRRNPKLEAVRLEQQEFRARQTEAGKRGADRRWHSDANGTPTGNPNGVAIGSPPSGQWRNDGSASASASASASTSERRKAFASQRAETPGSERRREEGQGMSHISVSVPKEPAA